MILALDISTYLFWWQLPLLAVYAVAVFVGGAYALRWALARYTALPRARRGLGAAFAAHFLANGAALLAGALLAGAFFLLGHRLKQYWLALPGALAGGLALLAVSWAVFWQQLRIPARTAARLALLLGGGLAVLSALAAGVAGWVSFRQHVSEWRLNACKHNVEMLHRQILEMERIPRLGQAGLPPPSLRGLVQSKVLAPVNVVCPAGPLMNSQQAAALTQPAPDEPLGALPSEYLYVAAPTETGASLRLRIADRQPFHGGRRVVAYANGSVQIVPEKQFQELLKLPENQQMAKLVDGK